VSPDDFPLARELDARLTRSTAGLDGPRARTLARIHAGRSRDGARLRPSLVFALGAVAAAVVIVVLGRLWPPTSETPVVVQADPPSGRQTPTAPVEPSPEPPPPTCASRSGTDGWTLEGACSLELSDPALTIASVGTSKLRVDGRRVTVDEGWVVFDVEPVDGPEPVRVGVATGTIEVLGTRFSVYQDALRGHVELVEGRIRFVDAHTRAAIVLEPGQRHGWTHGLPSPPEQTKDDTPSPLPSPPHSSKRTAPSEPDAPAGSLDDIARLRARGDYTGALKLIRRLTKITKDQRVREVLHYEAGTIIDDVQDDDDRACAHWAEHQRQFTDGRYRAEVARRVEQCPK